MVYILIDYNKICGKDRKKGKNPDRCRYNNRYLLFFFERGVWIFFSYLFYFYIRLQTESVVEIVCRVIVRYNLIHLFPSSISLPFIFCVCDGVVVVQQSSTQQKDQRQLILWPASRILSGPLDSLFSSIYIYNSYRIVDIKHAASVSN